jgi:Phosphoserine phosphatase RsbU, N-terminal domain
VASETAVSGVTPAMRGFSRAYAAAFDAYLQDRGEKELRAAYELGREAVAKNLSVLDFAVVHHDVLRDAARRTPPDAATAAACEFFLEALAAFEMVQRGFRDARAAAELQRRQAEMLRQLSHFLADASLALGASDSLEEMARLVAEQTRELIGAETCVVVADAGRGTQTIEAASGDERGDPADSAERSLRAPLLTLGGREIGSIAVSGKLHGHFTELDQALLVQLAQMASAAVERAGFVTGAPARGA